MLKRIIIGVKTMARTGVGRGEKSPLGDSRDLSSIYYSIGREKEKESAKIINGMSEIKK